MLKRIVIALTLVAGVAVAGVGSAAVKAGGAAGKKVEAGTKAPQGFCWPAGMPC